MADDFARSSVQRSVSFRGWLRHCQSALSQPPKGKADISESLCPRIQYSAGDAVDVDLAWLGELEMRIGQWGWRQDMAGAERLGDAEVSVWLGVELAAPAANEVVVVDALEGMFVSDGIDWEIAVDRRYAVHWGGHRIEADADDRRVEMSRAEPCGVIVSVERRIAAVGAGCGAD